MMPVTENSKREKKAVRRASPSRTAEAMAIYRNGELTYPAELRILEDPYAIRFLSEEALKMLTLPPEQLKALTEYLEKRNPGAQNYIVARARYIDDKIREALAEGLEQLVILGAGYDTRAYRIPELKGVRVFEVDHPGTQAVKKQKIRQIFGALQDHVVHVPVDFEAETLEKKLLEAGYSPAKKALFVLEGLVMYIPPKEVDQTLAFIVHSSAPGSTIVFDYVAPSSVDGTGQTEVERNFTQDLANGGEPLQFGLKYSEAEAFLAERGFSRITNLTAADLKKLYFTGNKEFRQVCSLFWIASAQV